jgi:sec-independent protein translocase protein TatC
VVSPGLLATEMQVRALLLVALILAALALVAYLLYRKSARDNAADREMTYLEHFDELRTRVVRVVVLLLVWVTVFISFRVERVDIAGTLVPLPVPSLFDSISARVFSWVVATTVPAHVEIITLSPTEAVSAQIQIAFVLAVAVVFPFLLYEAWAFFSPGLAPREQQILRRTFLPAVLLFGVGAAFGFRLVVPVLFDVLYGFATPIQATPFMPAGTLIGSVATLVLLFGFSFELPLVMAALVRLRLLEPQSYMRKWRHATIAIFVVAAIASDPTLTSQMIIGSLLLGLYWGGVLLSFAVRPPPATPLPGRPAA